MMTETYHKYVEVPNLKNFGYGIRYFDDDHTIYVSPPVYRLIAEKLLQTLDYLVLSYTRNQKPIDKIARDIMIELDNCPPGGFTTEMLGQLVNKQKKFVNPDLIVSPVQPAGLTSSAK